MATGNPPNMPATDFNAIGPRVGDPFPDLCLVDQDGSTVDLHEYRAGRRCLVVFIRSADW